MTSLSRRLLEAHNRSAEIFRETRIVEDSINTLDAFSFAGFHRFVNVLIGMHLGHLASLEAMERDLQDMARELGSKDVMARILLSD